MQVNPQIVDFLNRGLRAELAAVNQYWVEARTLSYQGYKKLAHGIWCEGRKEHRCEARLLIDRVIFLEGTPAMMPTPIAPGTSIQSIFTGALAGENALRVLYTDAIAAADDNKDYVTEDILEGILKRAERRIKKIESQIELINSVGIELYAQKKI